MVTGLAHTDRLMAPKVTQNGDFLPNARGIQQVLANFGASNADLFSYASSGATFQGVAYGPVRVRTATCQYRYPSPCGRPGVPQVRPPTFFSVRSPTRILTARPNNKTQNTIWQGDAPVTRHRTTPCFGAWMRGRSQGHLSRHSGEPTQWLHHNSPAPSFLPCPALPFWGSSDAAPRPANRRYLAAQPVLARPLSPMAILPPAHLSARRPMSPIARPIQAPAANLVHDTVARPAVAIDTTMRPRPSQPVAGVRIADRTASKADLPAMSFAASMAGRLIARITRTIPRTVPSTKCSAVTKIAPNIVPNIVPRPTPKIGPRTEKGPRCSTKS